MFSNQMVLRVFPFRRGRLTFLQVIFFTGFWFGFYGFGLVLGFISGFGLV